MRNQIGHQFLKLGSLFVITSCIVLSLNSSSIANDKVSFSNNNYGTGTQYISQTYVTETDETNQILLDYKNQNSITIPNDSESEKIAEQNVVASKNYMNAETIGLVAALITFAAIVLGLVKKYKKQKGDETDDETT